MKGGYMKRIGGMSNGQQVNKENWKEKTNWKTDVQISNKGEFIWGERRHNSTIVNLGIEWT
jgi:hypothetical protein